MKINQSLRLGQKSTKNMTACRVVRIWQLPGARQTGKLGCVVNAPLCTDLVVHKHLREYFA